jgi:heme-degrading monooxygenase HmoA
MISKTPKPPYIAAIFTSIRTTIDEGYEEMNRATFAEIQKMDGYLGFESFRNDEGFGVNVSYWRSMECLLAWKNNELHKEAQKLGIEKWYKNYKLRICTVERDYEFSKE